MSKSIEETSKVGSFNVDCCGITPTPDCIVSFNSARRFFKSACRVELGLSSHNIDSKGKLTRIAGKATYEESLNLDKLNDLNLSNGTKIKFTNFMQGKQTIGEVMKYFKLFTSKDKIISSFEMLADALDRCHICSYLKNKKQTEVSVNEKDHVVTWTSDHSGSFKIDNSFYVTLAHSNHGEHAHIRLFHLDSLDWISHVVDVHFKLLDSLLCSITSNTPLPHDCSKRLFTPDTYKEIMNLLNRLTYTCSFQDVSYDTLKYYDSIMRFIVISGTCIKNRFVPRFLVGYRNKYLRKELNRSAYKDLIFNEIRKEDRMWINDMFIFQYNALYNGKGFLNYICHYKLPYSCLLLNGKLSFRMMVPLFDLYRVVGLRKGSGKILNEFCNVTVADYTKHPYLSKVCTLVKREPDNIVNDKNLFYDKENVVLADHNNKELKKQGTVSAPIVRIIYKEEANMSKELKKVNVYAKPPEVQPKSGFGFKQFVNVAKNVGKVFRGFRGRGRYRGNRGNRGGYYRKGFNSNREKKSYKPKENVVQHKTEEELIIKEKPVKVETVEEMDDQEFVSFIKDCKPTESNWADLAESENAPVVKDVVSEEKL